MESNSNNNDYENLLFYFAYKTFINTADEIIEKYGLNRQHHRFLFFIEKVPGITIKDLLKSLEISKQGYIIEKQTATDKRVKALYPTDKGTKLVRELNKKQNDMFQDIQKKVGNDWYAIMEELASYRTGFQEVKYLKDDFNK